tara:strand:+ start:1783 stop:1992 length:210 start_codon:yes stop_codon:yes gene_type:complete
MRKAIKIVEYMWLFVIAASLFEIIRLWGVEDAPKLFYLSFFVGIFMYFFRRRTRLKMEERQKEKLKNQE